MDFTFRKCSLYLALGYELAPMSSSRVTNHGQLSPANDPKSFFFSFFYPLNLKTNKQTNKSSGKAQWDASLDTFALLRPNESTLYRWRREPESTGFLQTHRSSSFEHFSTACARSPHSQSNFRAGCFNPHRRHRER